MNKVDPKVLQARRQDGQHFDQKSMRRRIKQVVDNGREDWKEFKARQWRIAHGLAV